MIQSEFFSKKDFSFADTFTDIRLVYSSTNSHTEMYSARKALKRFALKALKPEFRNDPFYVGMLRKEFEIGLRLEHPFIIRTYSFEEVARLGPCIVLEWIDGETLESDIKKQALDERAWRRAVMELCEALEYLENCQIVHQDIKPSNIMLTADGRHVKLIDFGFADSPEYGSLKHIGGTRGYAAPEQVGTNGSPITHLSDIYAFGRLLQSVPLSKSKKLERLIDSMGSENPTSRPQDMGELKKKLLESMNYSGRRRIIRLSGIFLIICLLIVGMLWMVYKGEETDDKERVEAITQTPDKDSTSPEENSADSKEEVKAKPAPSISETLTDETQEEQHSQKRMPFDEAMIGEYSGGGYIYSEDYPILMELEIKNDDKVVARYKNRQDFIWIQMRGRIDKTNIKLENVPDPEEDFEMRMVFDYIFEEERLELSGYAEGADGDRDKVYIVLGKHL